jgi:peptide/nickel transport system substrate-binding protein
MDFYEATIDGGSPQSVDYSWIYDTASAEIVFNVMDTLVMFNTEHTDSYIPSLAVSWRVDSLTPANGSDSGIPIAGLVFENMASQTGPNATYYYRYVFGLNPAIIKFALPYDYTLTATDVVYSFQRTMVQDRVTGPSWMLYEPLLDNNIGGEWDYGPGGVANLTDHVEVSELGRLIEKAVMVNPVNSSEIWFNVMFPGAYGAFIQILTQSWASIISKQWMLNQVIGAAHRPDWDGNIAATKAGWTQPYTKWVDFHNPTVSPLDDPTPMLHGSGPFILTPGTPDYVSKFFAMYRNVNYWRGFPASFPVLGGIGPAGFCNTVEVTWAFGWATRKTMFLQGDADFVALPSTAYIKELYQSSVAPYDPPSNYPLQGVRCIHPLPTLQCNNLFLTFNIAAESTWEPVGTANTFNPSYVPPDFFGNAGWGLHMRRAFAKAFDYVTYLATALRNEGVTPATALIEGLAYHATNVTAYSYSLTAAKAELDQCVDKNGKKVTDVGAGFTINFYFNTGNLARKTSANLLKTALQSGTCDPNHVFTINVVSIDWGPYLTAAAQRGLACFALGWLADFPDPHDFVLPFYHTGGTFAYEQAYSNSTIDALIDQGIATPNGPARAKVYYDLQVAIVQTCPSIPISQPIGRHFEIDWVNGWYYNPIYPGGYYYNRWKWYYIPEVLYNTTWANIMQPNSTDLPADLTYDGKVLIDDVATAAQAFGTNPSSSRWMFRGDITGDRKILIDDIAFISKQFGKKGQPVWQAQGLLVYVTPVVQLLNASATWIFNATVIGGTPAYTYVWGRNGTNLGVNAAGIAFQSPGEGDWKLTCNVTDSLGAKGESEIVWVSSRPLTVAIDPSIDNEDIPELNGTNEDSAMFSATVDGGTINSSLVGGYHYSWWTNQTGSFIEVGTDTTYNLETTVGDIGHFIDVYLIVTDSSNTGPVVVQSATTEIGPVIA